MGRFYSNPKLGVPVGADHRYMANVISSAIVNKPPPQAVANLLARRNKLHHLDEDTDETLLKLFDRDPGKESKTSTSNHVTMPSRNWAMITENSPSFCTRSIERATAVTAAETSRIEAQELSANRTPSTSNTAMITNAFSGKDGHYPLHVGEETAGTRSRAADNEKHGQSDDGSLDIMIRVEKDQHDKDGNTTNYGLYVPSLRYEGATFMRKRDAKKGALVSQTIG